MEVKSLNVHGGDPLIRTMNFISRLLVLVGALNWGTVGLLDYDFVACIFGEMSNYSRVVYSLVGLSGVILLVQYFIRVTQKNRY